MEPILDLRIVLQTIERIDKHNFVRDSVKYLKARFSFSDDWNDVAKFAVFKADKTFTVSIPDDGIVVVPWEVLEGDHAIVSAYGTDGEKRITTNMLYVRFARSGYEEGEAPADPTPSVFDELVGKFDGLKAKVQELIDHGISTDTIREVVEEYMHDHPVDVKEADVIAILDKYEYAKKSDIPSLDGYAKLTDIPAPYDDTEIKTGLASQKADLTKVEKRVKDLEDNPSQGGNGEPYDDTELREAIEQAQPYYIDYGSDVVGQDVMAIAMTGRIVGVVDMANHEYGWMSNIDMSTYDLVFDNAKTLFKLNLVTNAWSKEDKPSGGSGEPSDTSDIINRIDAIYKRDGMATSDADVEPKAFVINGSYELNNSTAYTSYIVTLVPNAKYNIVVRGGSGSGFNRCATNKVGYKQGADGMLVPATLTLESKTDDNVYHYTWVNDTDDTYLYIYVSTATATITIDADGAETGVLVDKVNVLTEALKALEASTNQKMYAHMSADGFSDAEDVITEYVNAHVKANGYKIGSADATKESITEHIAFGNDYIHRGKIHKQGRLIVDDSGNVVPIVGIGTHWLTMFEELRTNEALYTLKLMGINCVRLTAYLHSGTIKGYMVDPQAHKTIMDELIPRLTALGFYIIIDWHSLHSLESANGGSCLGSAYTTAQNEFFAYFSSKYAGQGNIMYEIHNEPYHDTSSALLASLQACKNIIKANSPDAILITGHGSDGIGNMGKLIKDNNLDMFVSFHPYTAETPIADIANALSGYTTYPMFVSEWGNADLSGNGNTNDGVAEWFMSELYTKNIGQCVWKLSDQENATTAILKYDKDKIKNLYPLGGWKRADLTHDGKFYFDTMRKIVFGRTVSE